MQAQKIIFLIFFMHYISEAETPQWQSLVTYTFSGGRLGDNLIAYAHAKAIAHKYGSVLLYKPFTYSDQLRLHVLEQRYNANRVKNFKKIPFRKHSKIQIKKDAPILYIVPYFPECLWEHTALAKFPYFKVDWKDKEFITELREQIKPLRPLTLLPLPKDKITVALHIRKGTTAFDAPLLYEQKQHFDYIAEFSDVKFPLKFAPEEYYFEQLHKLNTMFNHAPMYVYIFTDYAEPAILRDKFVKSMHCPNMEFACADGQTTDASILRDFFSMMHFDCLIRSDSNFAIMASKIGYNKVVISPLKHDWQNNKLIITQVNLDVDEAGVKLLCEKVKK